MEQWDGSTSASAFHVPEWMVSSSAAAFHQHPAGRVISGGISDLAAPHRSVVVFSRVVNVRC